MPAARSGASRSPFFDGSDQFVAERRDVLHHTPPHDVAVAESWLVDPGGAGVHQVVLDAEASGGPVSADDAGGDADEPGVADQPDDLALTVGLGHQAGDLLVPAELVWSPPAGHDDRVEVVGRDVPGRDVAGCLEGMLPRTVSPPAMPTTVTSAASSRRRMSVTQNSRSSKPSARNTATLRPDNRLPSAMM